MVKVSICIPAYNNAEDVRHLLQSIRKQSFQDFEVVITDDSDDTEIEELLNRDADSKVRYIHNEQKLGHIYNWNKAISLAKGEYIKIMFSDDWFTFEDSLSEYVKMLDEKPDVSFAFSASRQVDKDHSYDRLIPEEFIALLREDYRTIFLGNHIGAPSGTIYRNNGTMFDEQSNWASDLVLYLDILSRDSKFEYSERPLVSIGLHGEQYTHMFQKRDNRIFNDYDYMFQKYELGKNARCRKFFMDEYIQKYGKGMNIAGKCGFTAKEYLVTRVAYLWQNKVVDYLKAAVNKLTGRS